MRNNTCQSCKALNTKLRKTTAPCLLSTEEYEKRLKSKGIKKENYINGSSLMACKYRTPDLSYNESQILNHLIGALGYVQNYSVSAVDVETHLRTKLSKSDTSFFFEHVVKEMNSNIMKSVEDMKKDTQSLNKGKR